MVDMKVQVYSKFRKNKIWKKWNLQSPWGMEHLTAPGVGASFKKWGPCCTPILLEAQVHSPNFQILFCFKFKKFKKMGTESDSDQASTRGHPLATGRCLTLVKFCAHFYEFFFPHALHILRMWSTLVGWLQHMPALTRPYPKTSNTHNFWSVGPKIMKFVLTRSLWQDASQTISKNLKIVWDQVTLPKTRLVTLGIFSPSGVK
jgi:hypothetical protein